jgi:Uma2 family endonuclease
MTAEEYLALADDGFRYQLIDGIVVISPRPSAGHQAVVMEIIRQIRLHLERHPLGFLLHDTHVHFRSIKAGADRIYRPDIVFIRSERGRPDAGGVVIAPVDLIVEIGSPDTWAQDRTTKRADYEEGSTAEYWLIDPHGIEFLRHNGHAFVEIPQHGAQFASEAIPDFVLDLRSVRSVLERW